MRKTNRLLDCLYPRCCPICHAPAAPAGELICPACLKRLKPLGEPRCKKCGKPLPGDTREYCTDCSVHPHVFDEGVGIFPYDEIMQKSILMFKNRGRREYGDFYVAAMLHYAKERLADWHPDCVVSVPLHPARQRQRGYNQSAYLAEGLSDLLGFPVCEALLRVQNTKAQKTLSAGERRRNLRQAFVPAMQELPYRRILLVDDVYTTGSTLDAVSKVLREMGAGRIFFLTVCQGGGY